MEQENGLGKRFKTGIYLQRGTKRFLKRPKFSWEGTLVFSCVLTFKMMRGQLSASSTDELKVQKVKPEKGSWTSRVRRDLSDNSTSPEIFVRPVRKQEERLDAWKSKGSDQ